jgi:uncharacterized Zn finger protein (UPF0148 family)
MNAPPTEEPTPTPEQRCPDCRAPLTPGAVLCVACGYDLKEGRKLETVREPEAPEAGPPHAPHVAEEVREPAAPPDLSLPAPARKKELEKNLDLETRVFWLEERQRELERRVSGTHLTSRDFGVRMFAVFGLWLVAFLAIAFCLGALAALVYFLTIGL